MLSTNLKAAREKMKRARGGSRCVSNVWMWQGGAGEMNTTTVRHSGV
jgi:hypothetical protein